MYPLPVFVFVFIPTSRPQQSLWCWKRQGSPQHGFNNKPVEDVQAGLSKGRQIRDQIANIRLIIEKARKFQKDIYPCFIDYTKAFDCVDHNKLWKALKETGISHHLTYHLRNLYAGQETTVRTLYGTADWYKIEKGVPQGCLLSCWLFNLNIVSNHEQFWAGWATSWTQDRWEK